MKTIKQWFESVENPILRKVLLMRCNKEDLVFICNSLEYAIYYAFISNDTPEDTEFWNQVQREFYKLNESPTFNAKYPVMQVEWLDENECIWCETKEETKEILRLMQKADLLKWDKYGLDTDLEIEHYSSLHKNKQCFVPKLNIQLHLDLAKSENYTIYPAKLFIKDMKQNLIEEI
jgi:hypothetical protein